MESMNPNELSGAALAYLGDAVIALMARRAALESGITGVGALNEAVSSIVRATAQSEAVARLEPLLGEDEMACYKRGRNSRGLTVPKSASALEYRRATGLEALFAFLYLEGRTARLGELFEAAFSETLRAFIKNGYHGES